MDAQVLKSRIFCQRENPTPRSSDSLLVGACGSTWPRREVVNARRGQPIATHTINESQGLGTWAPHQRGAVDQGAQDMVEARQRLIMQFARRVLQAAAPPASNSHKPAEEN